MKNSVRFIQTFQALEKYMADHVETNRRVGFSESVRLLERTDKVVARHAKDLLELAELRNAIVHDPTPDQRVIAEPHDFTVALIEEIADDLLHPIKVQSHFLSDVVTFEEDVHMLEVLKIIVDKGFYQFPVYRNGQFVGCLTEHGLTKWFAYCTVKQLNIEEQTLKQALKFEEKKRYLFIHRRMSLIELEDRFAEEAKKGRALASALITQHGKETETIIGIITLSDVARFRKNHR